MVGATLPAPGGVDLLAAANAVQRELGEVVEPGQRVVEALTMLAQACELAPGRVPWPGELDALELGRGAAPLRTPACDRYREALSHLRAVSEHTAAAGVRDALDALLQSYAAGYADAKAARSAVDFTDLELLAHAVLTVPEIGGRYRDRFARVMVDEMQDTNRVQLELIDLVTTGNLFMVGDAQQSIYGFRHADVELFEQRGRRLEARGERASLTINFRSRPEVLDVLNAAFGRAIGAGFRPLGVGRTDNPASEPRVELMVVDKTADWEADDGLASPWRAAEARVLAARVRALIDAGAAAAGDVVLLTRATTDLRVYERALEQAGVPTYVIGGRGYWGHPQVIELVSYLRALANPLDDEAWYATLISPMCGLSLDGLVLVADGAGDELAAGDAQRLGRFEAWFAGERRAALRLGAEELLDRALATTGYEQAIVALGGGRRRLANVRKLMRFAREFEAVGGSDLPAFLDFIELRASGVDGARESEAPVESEALDAVRLMTIHRSKGLEFPVVCVADLGRSPRAEYPLVRVGRDGRRLGLTLREPGTGPLLRVLDYDALAAEQRERDRAEERRLFYVAMTRARERLLVSGAARPTLWEAPDPPTPIGWIAPALVPDMAARLAAGELSFDSEGVAVRFVSDAVMATGVDRESRLPGGSTNTPGGRLSRPAPGDPAAAGRETGPDVGFLDPPGEMDRPEPRGPMPTSLSYTALSDYDRCGYRFYVQRVLGLPELHDEPPAATGSPAAPPSTTAQTRGPTSSGGVARGTAIHALLQAHDFSRPNPATAAPAATADTPATDTADNPATAPPATDPPAADPPAELTALLDAFAASSTAARLENATDLRREQPFAFPFGETLITGVFDVIAREPNGGLLVVDYKSDRLHGQDPEQLTAERYADQRIVYALAALRTGADRVEVVHLFLEDPSRPVTATYESAGVTRLEFELEEAAAGLLAGEFPVSRTPHRNLCAGCPAAGGLCPWPLELTTRPAPTEPAPTEPAPTEPAPTERAPTERAPTERAPTEPAPTEPAPTEPPSTDRPPTNPAPPAARATDPDPPEPPLTLF
jgi:ATP-dependent exoDNAse (exonuclease V) beta subunit